MENANKITDAKHKDIAPNKKGLLNGVAFFCPIVTKAFPMAAVNAKTNGNITCCVFMQIIWSLLDNQYSFFQNHNDK